MKRPKPEHDYNPQTEINALRNHKVVRSIPPKGQTGKLLLATWNIANLGVHKRRPEDYKVIAEIISWFELIAVQEIADNLFDFIEITKLLPNHFKYIFSDVAGNDERAAYIYDTQKLTLGPKIGEVVIVDSKVRHIQLPGITQRFAGFNRNPYLAGFIAEGAKLLFANCHLYFGPTDTAAMRTDAIEKRQLEAYAIARFCDLRKDDTHKWTDKIIALGDFNLPELDNNDLIYRALTKRGLKIAPHDTRLPTNVSRDKDYDQIAVVPGLKRKIIDDGVFDFDEVIFSDIWNAQTPGYWRTCAKYYISDHRPLWMQMSI